MNFARDLRERRLLPVDVKCANLSLRGQEERRRKVLERQSLARAERLSRARAAALAELAAGERERSSRENRERRAKVCAQQQELYASQLMLPEWMIEVPANLGPQSWAVLPRPEGKRCLVICSNGKTISRGKNGKIMHQFRSALPNGSEATKNSRDQHTVLDCVFHQQDLTFYVVDLLCWKGMDMYTTPASFRFFWAQSKLAEVPMVARMDPKVNQYRFQACPSFDCDLGGLEQAYAGSFPFVRDGLLFFRKDGYYHHGLSPVVLSWKDANTSRFPVDTPDGVNPYPVQMCVLQADKNDGCTLRGQGGDIVYVLEEEERIRVGIHEGDVARFAITDRIEWGTGDDMQPMLTDCDSSDPSRAAVDKTDVDQTLVDKGDEDEDLASATARHIFPHKLQFHEKCPQRGQADSSCKIVFQYLMRHCPLTITSIADKVKFMCAK